MGLLAIALATIYLLRPGQARPVALTLTAGSREGTRALLAEALAEEAKARGVILHLVETRGSEEALERLAAGTCDLALVQGGLRPRGGGDVLQVAALHLEPLHLLVKADIQPEVNARLQKLKGRRINLGESRSGTYCLASAALAFAGLGPGQFVADSRGYAELMAEDDPAALPDAVFTVSTLPSRVARHLVSRHGYRLVGLPFAEAFALSTLGDSSEFVASDPISEVRREHTSDAIIPAFTYGVEPSVPPPTDAYAGSPLGARGPPPSLGGCDRQAA
jgi:TRAP-type uncharacterized transport system substrate-binding protein